MINKIRNLKIWQWLIISTVVSGIAYVVMFGFFFVMAASIGYLQTGEVHIARIMETAFTPIGYRSMHLITIVVWFATFISQIFED